MNSHTSNPRTPKYLVVLTFNRNYPGPTQYLFFDNDLEAHRKVEALKHDVGHDRPLASIEVYECTKQQAVWTPDLAISRNIESGSAIYNSTKDVSAEARKAAN